MLIIAVTAVSLALAVVLVPETINVVGRERILNLVLVRLRLAPLTATNVHRARLTMMSTSIKKNSCSRNGNHQTRHPTERWRWLIFGFVFGSMENIFEHV